MRPRKPDEHSIEHEPHLQGRLAPEEPVEPPLQQLSRDEIGDNSIWDEPNMVAAPAPLDAITYGTKLREKQANSTALQSWLATLAVAVVSGPFAILGTLLQGNSQMAQMSGVLAAVLFAPLVEEVMKNAGALWVVETRPHWFRSRLQIAAICLVSGFVFAAVENMLYLHVYIEDPPAALIRWRWTWCVALHMSCALVAGFGTMSIWRETMQKGTPPSTVLGAPAMVTAIVLHGAYNAAATIFELVAHPF